MEPTNHFTPRAQQALAAAHKEATRLHHNHVNTGHILLGLLKPGQNLAVSILQKTGINLETLRKNLEKKADTAAKAKTDGILPYTPCVKEVLIRAGYEAEALNHPCVDTQHILLGLLHERKSVAARSLTPPGIDSERIRTEILRELDPQPSVTTPDDAPNTPTCIKT
jgi:ATP-dependent Clp protease ATP-binding subunit ClpC